MTYFRQRFRECVFNVVYPDRNAIEESSATIKPSATAKATTTTKPTTKPTVAGRAPTVAGQRSDIEINAPYLHYLNLFIGCNQFTIARFHVLSDKYIVQFQI